MYTQVVGRLWVLAWRPALLKRYVAVVAGFCAGLCVAGGSSALGQSTGQSTVRLELTEDGFVLKEQPGEPLPAAGQDGASRPEEVRRAGSLRPAAGAEAPTRLPGVLDLVLPPELESVDSPGTAEDARSIGQIVGATRAAIDDLVAGRSGLIRFRFTLIQPADAFEQDSTAIAGGLPVHRSWRVLAWDPANVVSVVRSGTGETWQQWVGGRGVIEQRRANAVGQVGAGRAGEGAPGGGVMREVDRLSEVLLWPVNPYGADLPLLGWWAGSSGRDAQGWRALSGYVRMQDQTFAGQVCAVLQAEQGEGLVQEWYRKDGLLVRVIEFGAQSPQGGEAVRPLLRDKALFWRVSEGPEAVPEVSHYVESLYSPESGRLLATLLAEADGIVLDEPIPPWMLRPERVLPEAP